MARSCGYLIRAACVAAAVAHEVGAREIVDSPATASVVCRDPFLQPFAVDSIWNTAIGSAAVYAPANIYNESVGHDRGPPTNFHNDQDWIIRASASDPLTPWINDAGQFPGLCSAHASAGRAHAPPIRFPASLVTDCTPNNNAAAVLMPDNKTILQFQPLYRPNASGPIIGWYHAGAPQDFPWEISITSGDKPVLQSALGSHGGSGLSGIGGTIRLGELLPGGSINHALKLELWTTPYVFGGVPSLQSGNCAPWSPGYNDSSSGGCVPSMGRNQYVWPAIGSDSGSQKPGAEGGLYKGSDRNFAPGSLLAIPPAVADSVKTTTAVGAKIKQALTDYGGYFVDGKRATVCERLAFISARLRCYGVLLAAHHADTGSKQGGAAICMEPGVSDEVVKMYGHEQDFHIQNQVKPLSPLYDDLLRVFRALHIVTNNGPESIGGGGAPRRPPAPPLCTE